jgi:methylated-DNA-protein-cysteine methyltransferase-like protein
MGVRKNSKSQGMGPPISVSKDQFAGELDTNQDISKAERIWQVVAQIPTGRVISYGDVAKRAGLPGYARYVGTTLGKLPRDTRLPWHRVVNASRKIAPRGSARMVEQKQRLDAEGVSFKGETVLKEFYW